MHIKEKSSNDVNIYDIEGDIDINSSPEIRQAFDKPIAAKVMKMLVNLKSVSYIDSSGLATLVELLKRTRVYGGKLRLSPGTEYRSTY